MTNNFSTKFLSKTLLSQNIIWSITCRSKATNGVKRSFLPDISGPPS